MEILKLGKKPKENIYFGECKQCGTIVKFPESEGLKSYLFISIMSCDICCPVCLDFNIKGYKIEQCDDESDQQIKRF